MALTEDLLGLLGEKRREAVGKQKDRMLAGELYINDDADLDRDRRRAMALTERFNVSPYADREARTSLLRELLGRFGEKSEIRPPFHCDFGTHIRVGSRTFINFGAMMLDVAPITIGDDCNIGPNVQFLTPTHPLEPEPRREKWEAAKPITLGDNVWLGGGVILLPGISIGENAIIGAGAVVTKSIAANVVAVGSPARIIRPI
jgi:maltose O-acetyltransferase